MPRYTIDKQEKFFAAYVINGTVRHACLAAGIGRKAHYRCMEKHPAYKRRFEEAKEDHAEMLISVAVKRGVKGTLEPVYYLGKKVGDKRRHHDQILLALLKARSPELFGDKQQISIDGEGLAVVEVPNWYGNAIHSDPETPSPPEGDTT